MKASKKQKQLIHLNTPTRDIKEEFVQWATGDVSKISCDDLTFDQANQILKQLHVKPVRMVRENTPEYWGFFTKTNTQHKYILSLLQQIGWVKTHDVYGKVADIERLGKWLQSKRSPVNKPLKKMTPTELSTIVNAFESMLGKKFGAK